MSDDQPATRIGVTSWRKGERDLDQPVVRLRITEGACLFSVLITPSAAKWVADQLAKAADYAESPASDVATEPKP
jgi:hypothetical protein